MIDIWNQVGDYIYGESSGDRSGFNVSINSLGNIVAIGARNNQGGNGVSSGHVRVYSWDKNNNSWIQLGQDIDGEAANDWFGFSVSLNSNGNILAVGANKNDGNGSNSGHARVFEFDNNSNNWNQLGLDIDGEAKNDLSGRKVSLNNIGNIVAVSAHENNNGYVKIYKWNVNTWIQMGSNIIGENNGDNFGWSLSLNSDGNRIAIGARYNGSNVGHARIFEYNEINNNWTQLGNDIDGEDTFNDFGSSISLNGIGDIVSIGAIYNDGGGNESGHVRVFKWDGTSWVQLGLDIDGKTAGEHSGVYNYLNDTGNI